MFSLKKRPAKVVRVKFTSAVNAIGIDDSIATGRAVGAVLDIDADQYSSLVGSVEFLGVVNKDGTLASPVKATRPADMFVPQPVPDNFGPPRSDFRSDMETVRTVTRTSMGR